MEEKSWGGKLIEQALFKSRRRFLKWGCSTAGLLTLPGCAALGLAEKPPKADTDIFVDAHAHIFNAEDLAIKGFLEKVFFHDALPNTSLVVDQLTQWKAPRAGTEAKEIDKLLVELGGQEFKKSDDTKNFYRLGPVTKMVRRYTARRYENAHRLIRTYENSTPWANDRMGIDRFIVALVDMDYWLNDSARTSVADQIRLTGKLTRLFPGRLYPFAPFDPLRNIVENGEPLEWVKEAVNNHGFVGVKMYPPMGFRPFGNTELDKNGHVWPEHFRDPFQAGNKMKVARYLRNEETEKKRIRNLVSDLANKQEKGLGYQLDKQLDALYAWCVKNDVAIMAHANDSNESVEGYEFLAGPEHWEKVLRKYPTLRVNLGHFGGWDDVVDNEKSAGWADQIVECMSRYPNVFADTGNYHKICEYSEHPALAAGMRRLFDMHDGILKERLLYASDWFMSVGRPSNEDYFTDFNHFFRENFPNERNALLSTNALNFLGTRAHLQTPTA